MKKKTENNLYGVRGVSSLFPAMETSGDVSIVPYTFNSKEDPLYSLRVVRDTGAYWFRMFDGDYVRLHIKGQLVMSDTGMERYSNKSFIDAAHGDVLIAGLGLGMVVHNITGKKEVKSITVVENNPDVIRLVAPKVMHPKLVIIEDDIHAFKRRLATTRANYDCIYFDIWPDISTRNLPEMRQLTAAYRRHLKKTDKAWMDCWLRDWLRKRKRQEDREVRGYR